MNASPEILKLLQDILNGECDRPLLARWLAESSLRFLESPNEIDRMIVADIDAALGEIQRGSQPDQLIIEIAEQLVTGLHLVLPGRETTIVVVTTDSYMEFATSQSNSGSPMPLQFEVEHVPQYAW